jgi:hypothetical protein
MKHLVPSPHKRLIIANNQTLNFVNTFRFLLTIFLFNSLNLFGQTQTTTTSYSPQRVDSLIVGLLEKSKTQTHTAMQIQAIYSLVQDSKEQDFGKLATVVKEGLLTENFSHLQKSYATKQIPLVVLPLTYKSLMGKHYTTLLAAAMAEGISSREVTFIYQPNFAPNYSATSPIGTLKIDFADGKGYQNIETAKPITINYPSTGFKKLQFAYQTKDLTGKIVRQTASSWLYVQKSSLHPKGEVELSPMPLVCSECVRDEYVNEQCQFIAPIPASTELSATLEAANNSDSGLANNRIDYLGNLMPDETFTINATPRSIWAKNNGVVSGDAFLFKNCEGKMKDPIVIVECFDEKNRQGYEWGVTLFQPFMKEVLKRGYSVVLVNFRQSGDYIENNGLVLRAIMQKLRQDYGDLSADPHFRQFQAVIGQSMGGQVARYELAQMERENLGVNVKNYISLDSPHRGANIPLGMQWMLSDLRDQLHIGIVWQVLQAEGFGWLITLANETKESLYWPSAQQMIKYHISNNGTSPSPQFNNWQKSLAGIGYPQTTRNVAIVNGDLQGRKATDLQGLQGQNVIEYEWENVFWVWIPVFPYYAPNPIRSNGKAYFAPPATQTTESRISFVYMMYTPIGGYVSQERNRAGMAGYDVAAGSYYETQKEVKLNLQRLIEAGATINFPAGVDRHTFIPSNSAADVVPPAGMDEDSDAYLNTPMLGSYTQPTFPYEVINPTQYGFKEVHPAAVDTDRNNAPYNGNIWHLDTKYLSSEKFKDKYFPDISPSVCPEPYFDRGTYIDFVGSPRLCIGRDVEVRVTDPANYATHYKWYMNGNLIEEFGGETFSLFLSSASTTVSVQPCSYFTNSCGTPIHDIITAQRCNKGDVPVLMVYPNPATDILHIDTEQPLFGVKITNAMGQVVYEIGTTEERPIKVNMATWANGVYVVQLLTESGILTEKVILAK